MREVILIFILIAVMSTCAHVRNIDIHLTKSEIKK